MSKVCICGAGPSAAYAVLACRDRYITPTVISHTPPSFLQDGAFFLHWLPERLRGLTEPHPIWISGMGTADVYTTKQWLRPVPSSFPEVPRWEQWYDSNILQTVWKHQEVLPNKLDEQMIKGLAAQYDLVLHTFPLPSQIGKRRCKWFPVRTFLKQAEPRPMWIVYNGLKRDPWVRMTVAFGGRVSFEFPDDEAVEAELEYNPLWKAMAQNKLRDIPPETEPVQRAEWLAPNVAPLGRFATWERKKLSHHAYQDTIDLLREQGA